MGTFNSSKTRVEPVFDWLVQADPTGSKWLQGLVASAAPSLEVDGISSDVRLVDGHGRRWGSKECSLPAPLALLEYLVKNITENQVIGSRDVGEVRRRRMALARKDVDETAAALKELRAGRRGRQWFVLEGQSRPDALLETSDIVLLVEGKRTEKSCTSKTKWMGKRSQLLRHMDAALEAYPKKRVLGLLVVEGDGGAEATTPSAYWKSECATQTSAKMLEASLPHRTPEDQARLAAGVVGVATWQGICAANGIPWPPPLDTTRPRAGLSSDLAPVPTARNDSNDCLAVG